MHRKVILFLIFFALLPVLVAGQGLIKGTITDQETGEALVGVNVIVEGTTFGAATDLSGDYVIINVDPGVYSVKASYIGYQSVVKQNITVNTNFSAYIDFALPSEAIATDLVVVTAEKPLIKRDATSSVRITNREDIENLPVRGVTNIVSLKAGVVVDNNNAVRIRGSRPDEVGYYLDGVNITDVYGGTRMVSLGNDAVEEVAVETGGYSAEYGGANAGIIRTSLRTGGPKLHASIEYVTDNVSFSGKDKFTQQTDTRMGAYWYGYNETSFTIGGPIIDNRFKFFYNLAYLFHRTGTQKAFDGLAFGNVTDPATGDVVNLDYPKGVIANDWDESYTHSATLSMDFAPVNIRLGGTYTTIDDITGSNGIVGQSATATYNFNRNRNGLRNWKNGSFSARITHVLSPSMFYELTAGYSTRKFERTDQYLGSNFWAFGDSVANANAGAQWTRLDRETEQWAASGLTANDTRYKTPTLLNLYSWTFSAPNSIPSSYSKSKRENINLKLNFSWLAGKHHSIKAGGEYTRHTMRSWSSRNQTTYARSLAIDNRTKEEILYANAVNNYGYDIYGNELDGSISDYTSSKDGFYAPHKPTIAAIYLLDKMEFSDIILNIGLRYDYINPDNLRLKDAGDPDAGFGSIAEAQAGNLDPAGFEELPAFSAVSPRLSVSFPVTDRTVFHASFGKYVQQPKLNDLYLGMHEWAFQLSNGFFFSSPNGMSITPTRKTHYELGFKQQLNDFMAVDISAYYDDVIDEVVYTQIATNPGSNYAAYASMTNGDFATNKGIEIVFNMRRFHRLAVNANFTFSDAKGTGANPSSNAGIISAPVDPSIGPYTPSYVSPLPSSKPFVGNFSIDYRFGDGDGGAILENLGVNILGRINGGSPYTRGTGTSINYETDSRFRNPIEALGSSMTPSQFTLDFKLDKTFRLFDALGLNIYLRVNNLFNIRSQEQVYSRTGSASDDGYLSNPDIGGKIAETFGQQYIDIYNALKLGYNGYYSDARMVLLGFRLEY